MKSEERRAVVAAYKERKVTGGVYTVQCAASGQIWVGSASDLSTIQNRLWFALRMGTSPHRSLQEAWRAHGGDTFTFEVVERLPDDESSILRALLLKKCLTGWVDRLQAIRL